MKAARAAAAGVLVVALAGGAAAHSLLLESVPAAGATLTAPPEQITLRFNNRIEKKLSTIRLVDERGAPRAVTVLGTDGSADRLTATLSPLPPGAWRIEWRVLSTDGHIVSGAFSFRVAP
jgi:methionine-rich copper-binding protein CopC